MPAKIVKFYTGLIYAKDLIPFAVHVEITKGEFVTISFFSLNVE